jgi:hypothetical protein
MDSTTRHTAEGLPSHGAAVKWRATRKELAGMARGFKRDFEAAKTNYPKDINVVYLHTR